MEGPYVGILYSRNTRVSEVIDENGNYAQNI